MSEITFYPAINSEWLETILKTPLKKDNMSKTNLCSIAMAINFSYALNGHSKEIKMSHKLISRFGLNRKSIVSYLEALEEAGILTLNIRYKASPKITLLVPPVRTLSTIE